MSNAQSSKIECVCEFCKTTFVIHRCRHRRGEGRYCSQACYHRAKVTPLIDRFFRYVGRKQESGCILWTGCTTQGYGVIGCGVPGSKKMLRASHVSYELFVGPVPGGLFVLHKCDNPPCINPTHLFLGTQTDNMADKVTKNRHHKGEEHVSAKLSNEKVLAIRRRYAAREANQYQLAAEYGVAQSLIWRVINKRVWTHVSSLDRKSKRFPPQEKQKYED